MRVRKARDYKRYRVSLLPNKFGVDTTNTKDVYAPTLREARLERTKMARSVGLPSIEIAIYDNVTGAEVK